MRVALTHDAMATAFQIAIACEEPAYARQAAAAAFAELDLIEGRLSRFAEGSDIFRINRLRPGEATLVHLDTFECLRIAEEVRRDTAGAFDVAYLVVTEAPPCHSERSEAKSRNLSSALAGAERCLDKLGMTATSTACAKDGGSRCFELSEESHTVRVLAEGVCLDLGGIGKGFALDRMAALLREWEVASALLCASISTILALDAPPGEEGWAVQLGLDDAPEHLKLINGALSASGTAVKGSHIVDPRTGRPAEGRFRAWALAPTAAMADALSTAFMIMSEEAVRAYCRCHTGIVARILSADGEVVS